MTAPPSGFAHPALLYRNDAEFVAGTAGFVAEGLMLGLPVAVALPGWNLALLRAALGAAASARVTLVDMTDAGRNPGRIMVDVLRRFADAHPDHPVRIIGEPVWPGRSRVEYPACVQHEALINYAFAGRPVSILCPYDVGRLAPQAIDDARATHPTMIDNGAERASLSYDPHRVLHELNLPLAAPAVAALRLPVPESDLAQVRAAAVACARTLGVAAGTLDDVRLVVSELASNSLRHGGGHGVLSMWRADGHVVCQLHDRGVIDDPLAGRRPVPPGALDGRGLLLVNRLADLVRVHTGPAGTTIQAFFADTT